MPSSSDWVSFLLRTLPGTGAEQIALWRATLAAQGMSPESWLQLKPRNRSKLFPLSESQEETLARRVPECLRFSAAMEDDAIWLMTPDDPGWPRGALEPLGPRAPEFLSGWGSRAVLGQPHVAVVGSRSATPEAVQFAEIAARSLVEMGLGVISGGARGIDQAAHRAALRTGGTTIFVLSEGVVSSTDHAHREELDPARVCLVSQVWPTQRFSTAEALARNHLIVALSQAVLVVAAESTGGSLRTGLAALEMRRPTLVIHHPEVTVHTAGNHRLRQAGAIALPAEAFRAGHAPAELRQALGRAEPPPPATPDLLEGLPS